MLQYCCNVTTSTYAVWVVMDNLEFLETFKVCSDNIDKIAYIKYRSMVVSLDIVKKQLLGTKMQATNRVFAS